jgi:ferric-dicitrate binding protein FerR (iron transport regulator)
MNDDLLVKYLLQEASAEERRLVEAWIAAGAANQRYFEHFKLIWDKSRELAVTSTVDEDQAWRRFQQRVIEGPPSQGLVRSLNRRFSQWRVAAMLVGTAVIIAMIYFLAGNGLTDTPVTLAATDNSQADTLPDGSVITLNKYSSLTYAGKFNKEERNVELHGEAFFHVTPDKQKPFIIHVNGLTVKVVGTSFNIKTTGTKTEVIVETGIVQVSNSRQTVELTPKEKLSIPEPEAALTKEPVTDNLYNYYRSREFVCDHTPLWKLVQVLNEAYNANIIIEGKDIRNLPLTATYHNESLDSILNLVSQTLDITIARTNSQIILK